MSVQYNQLEDRKGTIHNKITGKDYSSNADLAKDLAIQPHLIDWKQIKPSGQAAPAPTPIDPSLRNQPVSSYNKPAPKPAPVIPVSAKVNYNDLVDKNGTTFNTKTGKSYSTNAQLAADLGIQPHLIDWTKITPDKPVTPTNVSSPSVQNDQSAQNEQSEIEIINEEENKNQEEEVTIIEGETKESVDISKSASLTDRLLKILEDKKEDTPVSLEDKFLEERKNLGVGELETSLATAEEDLKKLEADYISTIEEEEGRKVSMAQVSRRQNAEDLAYKRAKRDLQIEKNSIVNQLNVKYGVINSIMKYAGTDYDNAQQDYQLQWNTTMQMTNLIKGIEDSEKTDEEKKIDNARANAQIMFNIFKDGNISYDKLDDQAMLDIKNTEIQAGFPVGFTQFIMETVDDPVIHFGSAFTDASGNRMQPIITVDNAGNLSVKNVNLGTVGATGDSKGPSSYQEWILAGGAEGTGKSYAEFIDNDSDDTKDEVKEFQSDVADWILKLDSFEVTWGTAWDSLHAKYPRASNETIDNALEVKRRDN